MPTKVNEIFSASACVIVPKYQRRYSWVEENAHSLIRDIAIIATNPKPRGHWTGVIIYNEVAAGTTRRCEVGQKDINHICREIIDGQQRLTTVRLWMMALVDAARSNGSPIDGFDFTSFYPQKPNDEQIKAIESGADVFANTDEISRVYSYFSFLLWLGESALLEDEHLKVTPVGKKRRLKGDTRDEQWTNWLNANSEKGEGLERSGTPDFQNLLIATQAQIKFLGLLLEEDDDAERIFSALNGNRQELSQFDHLRNWAFSTVEAANRDQIYDNHWAVGEAAFDSLQTKGKGVNQLKNDFLYNYLISLGEGVFGSFNASRSYAAFRRFERNRFSEFVTLENWIENSFEDEIALWKTQREDFTTTVLPSGKELSLTRAARRSLHRIRKVSDGPPAPLVLWILRRSILNPNDDRYFTPEDVERSLSHLEGYLFKTLLDGRSLTNLRSVMIKSMRSIDMQCRTDSETSASDHLIRIINGWNKTKWAELRKGIENAHNRGKDEGVYSMLGSSPTLALLDAIDEQITGATASGFLPRSWEHSADKFTVEHIYPQKMKNWKQDLKAWAVEEDKMNVRVHALGNLTAIESQLNKTLTNKRFAAKIDVISTDQDAMLSKLQSWVALEEWTPKAIDDRTHELLEVLAQLWPDPTM